MVGCRGLRSVGIACGISGSLLACNDKAIDDVQAGEDDDNADTGTQATTGADEGDDGGVDSSAAMTSAGSGDTMSADDDTSIPDPPIIFDLGGIPDAPPPNEFGCQGIDFLFVVDNSGSMTAQQAQLLNSFPGFITAIESSLENVDSYHVGVITSDNYAGNEPGCTTIGDLVTQTAGFGSSNAVCGPFASGQRYATDEDNLQDVFPCMAQVGTSGSPIEQPVTATIAAVDPAKAGPGGCNEGFLRDDAILVVVIVTDDPPFDFDMDDAHPATNTTTWFDDVVAAKDGDVESMVVIGFVPWMNLSCTFMQSPNLIGFVNAFGAQGVLASVCDPDYGPVFSATIETIESTCDNFVPPA